MRKAGKRCCRICDLCRSQGCECNVFEENERQTDLGFVIVVDVALKRHERDGGWGEKLTMCIWPLFVCADPENVLAIYVDLRVIASVGCNPLNRLVHYLRVILERSKYRNKTRQ